MTTKAQEREALQKIQKIIAGLGENSYIGTAFDGCFNIAEQNIEYDAAFSMKGELEIARRDIEAKTEAIEEAEKKLARQAKNHEDDARRFSEQKQAEIDGLKAEIAALQRPTETVIGDEFAADLAAFSINYVERIRAKLLQNASRIAGDLTTARLLHEYNVRHAAEVEDYARTVADVVKRGVEFSPNSNILTHASSYQRVLEDLLREYFN